MLKHGTWVVWSTVWSTPIINRNYSYFHPLYNNSNKLFKLVAFTCQCEINTKSHQLSFLFLLHSPNNTHTHTKKKREKENQPTSHVKVPLHFQSMVKISFIVSISVHVDVLLNIETHIFCNGIRLTHKGMSNQNINLAFANIVPTKLLTSETELLIITNTIKS